MTSKLSFKNLSQWHQDMLYLLLNADFPGKNEVRAQLLSSKFDIIDKNGSLGIYPQTEIQAPVVKTAPVEAYARDRDGIVIQVILFTRNGFVYMLEVLRESNDNVTEIPPVDRFEVMVLP